MIVNRLTRICLLLSIAICAPVRAQVAPVAPVQSLDEIRRAAEAAVRRTIDPALTGMKIEAVALDPRLRLADCTTRVDTFANAPRASQSRAIARVSCPSPAWTLNVPVEIHRSQQVLVLRRAVGRGESISADDVVIQRRELPGLTSPFVARPEELAGRLTRRPLPEGTALTAEALAAALLIKRGQQVTLVAQSAGFEVRAPGKAMTDASADQRVRVQNLNSLKIVEGLADKDGVVRVSP